MAFLSNLPTFANRCLAAGRDSGAQGRAWRRAAIAWWLFLASQVLLVLSPRLARSESPTANPTAAASSARRDWPERIPPIESESVSPADDRRESGRVLLVAAWLRQQEPPDAPRVPQELPTPPIAEAPPREIVPAPPTRDRRLDVEKRITAVSPRLATAPGDLPPDIARSRALSTKPVLDGSLASRRDVNLMVAWDAPALCHGPIYIEDVNLERYGYSHGILQPGYSAVHFLTSVALLPYLAGTYPQRECTYTLGYYRPGSYAPKQPSLPPLSLRGAALQAGVMTGAVVGVPGIIP